MCQSDKLSSESKLTLGEKKNPTTTVTSQIGLNIPVSGEALITERWLDVERGTCVCTDRMQINPHPVFI